MFTRITAHSRFEALLLSADAGPARLPAAAEKLQLPLVSVLPLAEVDAAPEQVSPGYDFIVNVSSSLIMRCQCSIQARIVALAVTRAEPPRNHDTEKVLRMPSTI